MKKASLFRAPAAATAAIGEACPDEKRKVHHGRPRGSVWCSMKRSLRLASLLLALGGGALFATGEVAAATKRKAPRKVATTPKKEAVDPAVIREAQNALIELGFYFGAVDGELSEETRGALRRFQEYKGLGGSGMINEPTLAALRRANEEAAATPRRGSSALSASIRPAATPPPVKAPERPAVPEKLESMENPLTPRTPSGAAVRPARPLPPPPARQASPEVQPHQSRPEEGPYYPFLRGTPYAALPLSAQEGVIRNLQTALAQARFYRGPVDGAPTAATEEALYRFQSAHGLTLSGRLDPPTLEALGLVFSRRASSSLVRRQRQPAQPMAPAPPPATFTQPQTLGPAGRMVVPRSRAQRYPAQQ